MPPCSPPPDLRPPARGRAVRTLVLCALGLALGCAVAGGGAPHAPPALGVTGARPSAQGAPAQVAHEDAAARAAPRADEAAVDAQQASGLAEVLALTDLLRLAAARNPTVREARARALAAAEGPALASRLPNPELRVGWYAEPVQTRTGTQEWTLGLAQALPWPGRLVARADEARARAEAADAMDAMSQWDVAADVTAAYHELAYLHGALRVSAAIEVEARRLVAIAAEGRAGRRSRAPELVRAETFLAQLEFDRLALGELKAVEEARLRALLALPPATPLGPPAPLAVPRCALALEDVQELAVAGAPPVARRRAELDAAEAALRASRTLRRPDLMLGARWISTDGYPGVAAPDQGNDPLVVELGVSLPLWEGANRAAVRKAEHEVRAARAALDGAVEDARLRAARAWWRVTNGARLVALHEDVLLPQAERAAGAAEGLFEAGEGAFAGLLETVVAWQHFQLAELRARADLGQAVAELERVLGAPLELVPASGAAAEEERP